MATKKQVIRLGSGHVYIDEFTGTLPATLDEIITQVKTEEKRLGYISGGATLEYTPENYTASDDLGYVQKTIMTNEEALLKMGVLTFSGDTLAKLAETARVSTDAKQRTVVKIGGASNANGKNYILMFHHVDKTDGDIYIVIVGKNQAGFSLAFAKDQETVIDAEFKAMPQDGEGTLIQYIEEPAGGPVEAIQETEVQTQAVSAKSKVN